MVQLALPSNLWSIDTDRSRDDMADTIKVVSSGPDPQTGGDAITIEVQYGDAKKATILLKPGRLPSINRDLPDELNQLAKALQKTPISHSD